MLDTASAAESGSADHVENRFKNYFLNLLMNDDASQNGTRL